MKPAWPATIIRAWKRNSTTATDWSLYVNPEDHANSVHGQENLNCVQCHTNFDQQHVENPVQFPGFNAVDRRDASLKLYPLCQQCHADQYDKANDSVHGRALQAGNVNAAICTDCHGSHTVKRLTDPATGQVDARCAPVDSRNVRQMPQHDLRAVSR